MSRSVLGNQDLSVDGGLMRARLYDLFRKIDRQFVKRDYRGEVAWNPGAIANGDNASTTVDARDARAGDAVIVFPPYSLSGLGCSGYVSANDTVTIVLANNTGAAVDLDGAVWRVMVEKW